MPWTQADVKKHKAGLTSDQEKKWVKIANTVLKGCMKDTGNMKKCEVVAIKIADSRCTETKRMLK